jgi:hypothetical protein
MSDSKISVEEPNAAVTARATSRIRVVLLLGAFTGALALARAWAEPNWPTDFDQLWFGARALARGVSPYEVIGPGRAFRWDWNLFYPLPAVLLALPFAPFPVAVARVMFATLSGGVLAFAVTREGFARLPLFLSASFLIAIWRTQWSPLLTAVFFLPTLGALAAAKPNVGLAVLAGSRSISSALVAVTGMSVLFAVSLAALPSWPNEWLTAIRNSPHIQAPATRTFGAVLLLALLKWRRRDARILAALAVIPHTPSMYDLLPLFVAARSRRESLVLALLSHLLFLVVVARGPYASFDRYAEELGDLALLFVYVPALAIVLRRPNVRTEISTPASAESATGLFSETDSRFDFVLFLLLMAASTILTWVTLVTRR